MNLMYIKETRKIYSPLLKFTKDKTVVSRFFAEKGTRFTKDNCASQHPS